MAAPKERAVPAARSGHASTAAPFRTPTKKSPGDHLVDGDQALAKDLPSDCASTMNSRNCSTKAQEARILAALRLRPQSTDDLRSRLGIFQTSARIKGLRNRGYDIRTDLVNSVDAFGFPHPRTAVYTLVSGPNGERP